MTDVQFKTKLREHLTSKPHGQDPVVPISFKADGSVDRSRTLAMPAYWRLTEQEKAELCA